jgi:hypothetical protein
MRPTLLFFLFLSLQVSAQSDPLAVAAPDVKNTAITAPPADAFRVARIEGIKPPLFDRKFLVLAGISTAATLLDITTTSNCIFKYSNCQEANPLLGSHPSRAKIYGVNFSLLAGELFASAWLRHQMPHKKSWLIPPLIGTAGHGLAAVLNFRTIHQINSAP